MKQILIKNFAIKHFAIKHFAIYLFLTLSTLSVSSQTVKRQYSVNYRDSIVSWYNDHIGIKELTGNNDSPEISKMLKAAGAGEKLPWCGAFINYPFYLFKLPRPSGAARAAAWSESPNRLVWKTGMKFIQDSIKQADIATLYYTSLHRVGHVFAIDKVKNGMCTTWEGNTNAEGSRDGNQSARRRRLIRQIFRIERWTPEPVMLPTVKINMHTY